MKTKIPPPIVAIVGILLIYFSRNYFNFFYLHPHLQNTLSLLFLISGILIAFLATREFKKQETTVNPMKPKESTSLVVSGVFQYTRNPMYLGLAFILLASCFYFNSFFGIIIYIPLFIFYITIFQILPEEEAMRGLFKDKYIDYCSNVRRWL